MGLARAEKERGTWEGKLGLGSIIDTAAEEGGKRKESDQAGKERHSFTYEEGQDEKGGNKMRTQGMERNVDTTSTTMREGIHNQEGLHTTC